MGPLHGYGIAQRVQQVSENMLQLNQGTICYPALLRLEQRGWIDSEWGRSDNNRRARCRLTAAGQEQLAVEAENWERIAGVITRLLQGT